MSAWRVFIALILFLLWIFSDCSRSVTQYLLGFVACLSTPLLFGNSGRESGTQTEEDPDPDHIQESADAGTSGDVIDGETQAEPLESQYPHVKRSLQQVFGCAYAQLVRPWYAAPEPSEDQPLRRLLGREFDFVIDRVTERAEDFDVCQAVVGSIRILTQHLHNAKQPDRELLFSSRAEEVAVLRELADALVRNLFPKSLWGQEVNRCALKEIIALKGLGLLVTWLSDPDNLNQLVVSQLDSVTPKSSAEELCGSDPDQNSLASQEGAVEGGASQVNWQGAEGSAGIRTKGKRKGNKLKEGWSKFVDKMKSKKAKKKKMKKVEQALVMRIISIQASGASEEDASSREGSLHTEEDSDREDSDLENYLTSVQEDMMEFKLSYEMWRVGRWAVTIPHADWEDEELTFTLHLEEKDSPENLQWDINKTYMDVIYFRNRWQDATGLPLIPELQDSDVRDEAVESARASVEHFLQELVGDDSIGHTQPVFQFLCPLDKLLNEEEHYGGVWGLLSGLAYFLTPGHEEEESSALQTEAPKENAASSLLPESSASSADNHGACAEKDGDRRDPPLPAVVVSRCRSNSDPQGATEPDPRPDVNSDSSGEGGDRADDSDNPLTAHLKMIIRGLTRSRSQESLTLAKVGCDEEPLESGCGGSQREAAEAPSRFHFSSKSGKKEKVCFRMSGGASKAKAKEALARAEDGPLQKNPVHWEQLEATKAIFDLLKEISGNSILINIFDAILKPVMPILKRKINSFLNKLNPSEAQMASYVDTLRNKLWPESPPPAPPPRTDEDKDETRDRAHGLINAKYSSYLVLKKTDVDSVFNLFQDREENKTLVYVLLSFLVKEFLPNENSLTLTSAALHKVTNSVS